MKSFLIPLIISIVISMELYCVVIEVCPTCPIKTLQVAAPLAQPGDSIVLSSDYFSGNNYISNLRGTPDNWITITAAYDATRYS